MFQDFINASALDAFAKSLSSQGCWFGALDGCGNFQELCGRIDARIVAYRLFHQYNADLPPDISSTKTNIHEPIARAEQCLKESGVIASNTPVFGTEQRSTAVWIEMSARRLLANTRLLRIQDSISTLYAAAASKALDERTNEFTALGGSANWIHDLTLHAPHSQIVSAVDDCAAQSGGNIVLDITSLPNRFFFLFMKRLLRADSKQVANMIVTYAVPDSYPQGKLADNFDAWEHLPF